MVEVDNQSIAKIIENLFTEGEWRSDTNVKMEAVAERYLITTASSIAQVFSEITRTGSRINKGWIRQSCAR